MEYALLMVLRLEPTQELNAMGTHAENVRQAARTISDVGSATEQAAKGASDSHSTLSRVGVAVTGVKLGVRLLPHAMRWFRRYPLAAALVTTGAVLALWSMRIDSRRRRNARTINLN